MECYCRNCGYKYNKTVCDYYKPITSQGFPMCIRCSNCVDCSSFLCQCTRCCDCYEVLNVCRCDNDPTQYSNQQNAFSDKVVNNNNHQMNDLNYRFRNMHL